MGRLVKLGRISWLSRSSTFGSAKTNGVKPDPRPLSDKGYQSNAIENLIAYLSTHGYDHEVSHKMLTSPMTKDFVNIVHFLMKQVCLYYNALALDV